MSNYRKGKTNLPQGYPLDQQIIVTDSSSTPVKDNIVNPSVVVYGWIPTIGDGNTLNSGTQFSMNEVENNINTAGAKYYKILRGHNASLSAYSPADVIKALIALDSVYGLLAELQMDIVILSQTKFRSYAWRGLLARAIWTNPDTASKNLANLVYRFNTLCNKLTALPFIPNIPFLQNHIDWASKIYQDDNLTDESALIVFRRSGYYYWMVDINDPDPGFIQLRTSWSNYSYSSISTALSAEDRLEIVTHLIDTYKLDTDFCNMVAEIYKAMGGKLETYNVPKLPENLDKLEVKTTYDLDVIDSLRNADFHYLYRNINSIDGISEDSNGNLTYSVGGNTNHFNRFVVPAIVVDNDNNQYISRDSGNIRVFQSYEADPSEESLNTSARYMHFYKHVDATNHASYVYGLRTEFLTGIQVVYMDKSVPSNINTLTLNSQFYPVSDTAKMLQVTTPLTGFPTMYMISIAGSTYTGTLYPLRKDIDKLCYQTNDWLILNAADDIIEKFNN